ncbi:KH domain-containing protein [Candidatus Saccharibacteria bacterium]|nr:KH domain-containing protein [Candidatus Saccharibacteria bacterium]
MSQLSVAQAKLQELLRLLNIEATVEVDDDEEHPTLMIDSADQALLIGRNGDNLRALQHVLNVLLRREGTPEGFVAIDVAGYKKERTEKLKAMAQAALEEAVKGNKTVRLKPMNAYERRQVHMYLADSAEVVTESEGQEPHRIVVVKKRLY